jgi:protein-disulfide isomerase
MDAFAKCLTKKNAILYGSYLCPHCDDQKKMFGKSFKHLHYFECSRMGFPDEVNKCRDAQIRYTPTWVLGNGEHLVGLQTMKNLSEKSGCPLP